MTATPLLRQPLATAIAALLLAVGVAGTVWATSAADGHARPAHSDAAR